MNKKIDPRTKLFIVFCFSSMGVVITRIPILLMIMIAGILFGLYFGVSYGRLLKKFKRILMVLLAIIVIQSLFTRAGEPLIEWMGVGIITDVGLKRGLGYFFRVLIILLSGSIIATSSSRDMLQSLNQLKIPYDLALMVSLGIRFMPLLMKEVKNTYLALQLKGIDIKSLKIKQRIDLIAYLFMPTIVGTLVKSEHLTYSIEARGYRVSEERSSYRTLMMAQRDWLIITIGTAVFGSILWAFYTI
jgi:energy-coupling factor transport system permease protein